MYQLVLVEPDHSNSRFLLGVDAHVFSGSKGEILSAVIDAPLTVTCLGSSVDLEISICR